GNVAGDSLSENWKAREQADDEKENRCRPQNLAALHGAPLFAYLESKLNCVLQKLSRKICSRYGRHHLNDEKHPCTFRTGKGGNPGLSRSVTHRAGIGSGLPRRTARHRLSPPQILIGCLAPVPLTSYGWCIRLLRNTGLGGKINEKMPSRERGHF